MIIFKTGQYALYSRNLGRLYAMKSAAMSVKLESLGEVKKEEIPKNNKSNKTIQFASKVVKMVDNLSNWFVNKSEFLQRKLETIIQ